MFEETQDKYSDGDVVWVKLGNCWWPGEVCGESRLPEELLEGLKKQPKVVVKFFQEDTFEYVFNLHHIFKYDCEKKNEFIKKGLDLFKAKHKYMEKFPADVTTAEQLTGGDPDIINATELVTPKRQKWLNIFQDSSSKKRKPKIKNITESSSSKNRGRPVVNCTPKKTFTPSRKNDIFDYSSPSTSYSCSPVTTPSSTYKCHLCDFSSTRLNALMFHNRNFTHSAKIASNDSKFSNKKKINIKKIKERLDKEFQEYDEEKANEVTDDDDVDVDVNVTVEEEEDDDDDENESRSTTPKSQKISKKKTNRKRKRKLNKNDIIENNEKISKKSKPYSGLQVSLLADWSEDESDISLDEKNECKKNAGESVEVNEEEEVPKQPIRSDTETETENVTIENLVKSIPEEKLDTSTEQKSEVPLTTTNKTKYRNIPKKERREFVIEEPSENVVCNNDNETKTELLKSCEEKPVYENNNSSLSESNNSVSELSQHADNDKQEFNIKTCNTVELTNDINTTESVQDSIVADSENVKNEEMEKKETKLEAIKVGEEIVEEKTIIIPTQSTDMVAEDKPVDEEIQNVQSNVVDEPDVEISNENCKLDNSVDEDTNNTKESDITIEKKIIHEKMSCFDFKEDEDESIILPKSPPRKRRLKKKDDEDDKSSDGENDNNISNICEDNEEDIEKRDIKLTNEIDNLLSSTDVPILPELPDSRVIKNDDYKEIIVKKKEDDLESKERALPPKERGKRIFKSRNRDKLIQEADATGEIKLHNQPKIIDPITEVINKSNSDLEINPSALSLQVVTTKNNTVTNIAEVSNKEIPNSKEYTNHIEKKLLNKLENSDVISKNQVKTIPLVPKKKHLQTALKEEAAINNNNNNSKKIEDIGAVVSIKDPFSNIKITEIKSPEKLKVNTKSRDPSPVIDFLRDKKTVCDEIELPVESVIPDETKLTVTSENIQLKIISPKSKIADNTIIDKTMPDVIGNVSLTKFEPRTPKKRKQTPDEEEKIEKSKITKITTDIVTTEPSPPKLAKQVIKEQIPSIEKINLQNKKIILTASSSSSLQKNLNVHNINTPTTIDDSIFDINNMPIVISNEPLTSESIENMPIVLAPPTPTKLITKTTDDNNAIIIKKTNQKLIINKSDIKRFDPKSFISFSKPNPSVFKNVTSIGQTIVNKPKINVHNSNFVIIPSSSENNKQSICKLSGTSNLDVNKKTINSTPISISTVDTTTTNTTAIGKGSPNKQVILSNHGITKTKNTFVKIPANKIVLKSDNKDQIQKIVITSNKPVMQSNKPNILSSQTIVSSKNLSCGGKLQSSSIILPKGQIIQAGTGGQIVITSKGQIITTNTQTNTTSKVLNITSSTRATDSNILSSTSRIKSPAKIQVQSQKIICAPKVTTITTVVPSTKVTVQSQISSIEKNFPEVTSISSSTVSSEKPMLHKKTIILNKIAQKSLSPSGQDKLIIQPAQSTVQSTEKNKISPQVSPIPVACNSKVIEPPVDRCKLSSKKNISKQPIKKTKVIFSDDSDTTVDHTVDTELSVTPALIQSAPIADLTYTKVSKKIKLSPSTVNNITPIVADKIVEPVTIQQKHNVESPVLDKTIVHAELNTDTILQDTLKTASVSATEAVSTLAGNDLETVQPIDSQLLALPGEGFGGPPNSFYLCTVGDNGNFIPIDNQPLYLDASNQLVPTPTESISHTSILDTSDEIQTDLLTNELLPSVINDQVITDLSQLQENQTYIINTGDGQQIIVDQQSLLALASGGELPQLMTSDGQQLILQGLPQDILSAVTINTAELDTIENDNQKMLAGTIDLQTENRIMPWEDSYDDKNGTVQKILTQNVDELQFQTSNHDILAAALASTDVFPKDQGIASTWEKLPLYSYDDKTVQYLGQPKLINQPLTAHVSETNAVLHRPIMSTLEVPSTKKPKFLNDNLETGLGSQNINESLAVMGLTIKRHVPKSLELPITITNPAIAPKTISNPISLTTIYPTSTAAGSSLSSSQISPTLSIMGSLSSEISFDILGGNAMTTNTIINQQEEANYVSNIVANDSCSEHLIDSNVTNSINELKEDVTVIHNDNIDDKLSKIIILPASPKSQNVNALSPFVEDSCSNSSEISLQPDLVLRPSDYQSSQQNIINDNITIEQIDNNNFNSKQNNMEVVTTTTTTIEAPETPMDVDSER